MQGKLLAGVNAKVQLYRWAQRDDGSRELVNECNHAGHVYVLYMATRGDFILVGERSSSPASVSLHPRPFPRAHCLRASPRLAG